MMDSRSAYEISINQAKNAFFCITPIPQYSGSMFTRRKMQWTFFRRRESRTRKICWLKERWCLWIHTAATNKNFHKGNTGAHVTYLLRFVLHHTAKRGKPLFAKLTHIRLGFSHWKVSEQGSNWVIGLLEKLLGSPDKATATRAVQDLVGGRQGLRRDVGKLGRRHHRLPVKSRLGRPLVSHPKGRRRGRRRGRAGGEAEELEGWLGPRAGAPRWWRRRLGGTTAGGACREAHSWEMKVNLWLIWIQPKRPNGFSGEPFSPLGFILG
jgi:hypothetical protein